jgi:hypothetical protein
MICGEAAATGDSPASAQTAIRARLIFEPWEVIPCTLKPTGTYSDPVYSETHRDLQVVM